MPKPPRVISPTASAAATQAALNAPPVIPPQTAPWLKGSPTFEIEAKETSALSSQPVNVQTASTWRRRFSVGPMDRGPSEMDLYAYATLQRYAYMGEDAVIESNLLAALGISSFRRVVERQDPLLTRDEWTIDGIGIVVVWPGIIGPSALLAAALPQMTATNTWPPHSHWWKGLGDLATVSSTSYLSEHPLDVSLIHPCRIFVGHSAGGCKAVYTATTANYLASQAVPPAVASVQQVITFGMPAFLARDRFNGTPNSAPDVPEPWLFMVGFGHHRFYNPADLVPSITSLVVASQYRKEIVDSIGGPVFPDIILQAGVHPFVPIHWDRTATPILFTRSAGAYQAVQRLQNVDLSNPIAVGLFLASIAPFTTDMERNHAMTNYTGRIGGQLARRQVRQDVSYPGLVAANLFMDDEGNTF